MRTTRKYKNINFQNLGPGPLGPPKDTNKNVLKSNSLGLNRRLLAVFEHPQGIYRIFGRVLGH